MFGWINDCCESLIVTKFGQDIWHKIKAKAGCQVTDGGFIRHQYYTDQSSIDLVVAASEVLEISVNDVLEVFGAYFMEFTRQAGYDNLLSCQGSNLRLWLSNLNALHDHLQDTLPRGRFPEFWCKDDEDPDFEGTILLFYFSERGSLFVPFVKGLVREVARYHFDVEITMNLLQTQGEDGFEYSCWRIGTVDPKFLYILSNTSTIPSNQQSLNMEDVLLDADIKNSAETSGCPFHHMQQIAKEQGVSERDADRFWDRAANGRSKNKEVRFEKKKEGVDRREGDIRLVISDIHVGANSEQIMNEEKTIDKNTTNSDSNKAFMSNTNLMKVFPYHLIINEHFKILQSGASMPKLVGSSNILGRNVSACLEIKRPLLASWTWESINRFDGQTYFFFSNFGMKKIGLKGHLVELSHEPKNVMIFLAPDARNIEHLTNMGLTMSDLPTQTFQRDAIFLGEHMYSGIRSAHKLDKLSRKLVNERNLSNTLLYSMLPTEVAKVLRAGEVFEPRHHENVTLFFSDIVGFTDMCAHMTPWDTIDMLNRLYTIMDYLADYFGCYKIETVRLNFLIFNYPNFNHFDNEESLLFCFVFKIGDAYMCCSGLPEEDEKHAEKVTNFALAAIECVSLVRNPISNEPIQIRIGVHSGACTSGVVGTKTPKFTIFGDMVNTTSRHESSGEAGKIQCSSTTFGNLKHTEHYNFTPRGLVDMKGKGKMYTYWLDSPGNENPSLGSSKLSELRKEVDEMLGRKTWRKRQYFERRDSYSTVQSINFSSADFEEDQEEKSAPKGTKAIESDDVGDQKQDKNEDLPPIKNLELDPQFMDLSSHTAIHNLLQDDLNENIHSDPNLRRSSTLNKNDTISQHTLLTELSGSDTIATDTLRLARRRVSSSLKSSMTSGMSNSLSSLSQSKTSPKSQNKVFSSSSPSEKSLSHVAARSPKADVTPKPKQNTHSKMPASKSPRSSVGGSASKRAGGTAKKLDISRGKENKTQESPTKRRPSEVDAFFDRMYSSTTKANKVRPNVIETKKDKDTLSSPKRRPSQVDAFFQRMYSEKTAANKARSKK